MPPSAFTLNTGQSIPSVGFGTWKAEPGVVAAAVEHALKVGYRLIDAAYAYGNEDEVGQGIKEAINSGHVTRSDIFVVTKLWTTHASRAEVGLTKSLNALGLDYVDLFLVHFPVAMNPEGNDDRFPTLPSGERDIVWEHDHIVTWKDMEALVKTGKTRSIGVCNYSVSYMKKLIAEAEIVPAVNQIENHPRLPQQDVVDFSRSKGIHVMAYSPLGSSGGPLMNNEVIVGLAKRKNVGSGTILLSYAVARGNTVLAKSVNSDRITCNLNIVDLSGEDLQLIGSCLDDGQVERYVYPPFGINLGFPDKTDGRRMVNGA